MPPLFRGIVTPDLDDRKYAVMTLPNGLMALLISDPAADKAAAALDVHVGHLSDGGVSGLAHFCEHLLFMGTTKYPQENEYNEFLSAHGGYSNAFTGTDSTNYYFEVAADHLSGAFDRFVQFFISPLFSESCTDREMNAVDSEQKKNLQSDAWRIFQLEKDYSHVDHPYNSFGTGNLETLRDIPLAKGLDIREILLEFHSKYYSSNIMKVVILGKEPLEDLAEMVLEKASPIKSLNISPPSFPGHPLSSEFLETQILVKPVKADYSVEVVFPLPDYSQHYRSSPSSYISHLVGHESAGSILSYLKSRSWAQELGCSVSRGGINFSFFKVLITLTEEGLNNWEDVVVSVFHYLDMLRSEGVQDWIFDEYKRMTEVSFRFREKMSASSYVSRLAGNLQRFPPEHVLSGGSVVLDYDKSMIEDVLSRLNVNNFRVVVVSPTFTSLPLRGKHYGTEHSNGPISDILKNKLKDLQPSGEFFLPTPNVFIPENFSLVPDSMPKPVIIQDSALMRIWHKQDAQFSVPKAKVSFVFRTPLSYATPQTSVMTRLYLDVLWDELNEFSYFASCAGLNYSVDNSTDGIELSIFGYNDKIGFLLGRILEIMKSLQVAKRFPQHKELLGRSYQNHDLEQPHSLASYYISLATQEKLWTASEKLEVLDETDSALVQTFIPQLLSRLHVEGLVIGNVDAETALSYAKMVETILQPKPLPVSIREQTLRTVIIPTGIRYVNRRLIRNPQQPNSAVEYNIQIGDIANDSVRVKSLLLAQIIKEPCFNILRTKEQLGYICFSGLRKQTGMVGLRIIIQSEKTPWHVEERIVDFLLSMREHIGAMTEVEFEKQKGAVVTQLTEKEKSLYQSAQRVWTQVQSRYCDFDQLARDAAAVVTVSHTEILQFFNSHVAPDSASVRKISSHMWSPAVEAELAVLPDWAKNQIVVDEADIAVMKMGLALGPGAVRSVRSRL